MSFAKVIATLLLICTISISGSCQDYAILNSGDTLFGSIRILDDIASCNRLVIDLPNGDVKRYGSKKIREYYRTFEGGSEVYKQREVLGPNLILPQLKLLKVIVEGKATVLEHTYRVNSGTGGFGGYTKIDYFLDVNGQLELAGGRIFDRTFSNLLSSNQTLSTLIRKEKLDRYEIEAIAMIYNAGSNELDSLPAFDKGHVILENGNRIEGFVKRIGQHMSCMTLIFVDKMGMPYDLSKSEVQSYKRLDHEFIKVDFPWSKRKFSDSTAFMRLLESGEVNLLRHVIPGNYTEKSMTDYRSDLVGGTFDQANYYLQRGDSLTYVDMNNFRKDLQRFFADHPTISERIRKRKLKFRDLKAVVKEYNNFNASK